MGSDAEYDLDVPVTVAEVATPGGAAVSSSDAIVAMPGPGAAASSSDAIDASMPVSIAALAAAYASPGGSASSSDAMMFVAAAAVSGSAASAGVALMPVAMPAVGGDTAGLPAEVREFLCRGQWCVFSLFARKAGSVGYPFG